MKLEDFRKLTDEEQAAVLQTAADNENTINDLTAERNSLKNENDELKQTTTKQADELAKTKELNFSLARKLDTGTKADPDEMLFKFIKGE